MADTPILTLSATVLGATDARSLADFYRRLLGWVIVEDEAEWVVLRPPGGGSGLSFQTEERYAPPIWPAGPGQQQEGVPVYLDPAGHPFCLFLK
jgi:catechol 2,3-dioxygenase-like lactoylglutathione lyase family enzyme